MTPSRPFAGPALLAAGLFALAALALRADEFATIDFPISGRKITASGLPSPPRQVAKPDGFGYAEVLLRPVRRDSRVFLTFIFREEAGVRGPAVFWNGDASGERVTISENLGEGVVGLNRRTILLPPAVSNEPGRLYIIGRQDLLLRLRIDWCDPKATLVAADQEQPALFLGGTTLLDRDVTGQAAMTPPDVWFGRVLDASLQDGVAELSENTELVVPLKGLAGTARLRARLLGLPLGKGVRVWVNGKLAGRLTPVVPSLTDPGYIRRDKRTAYAGWREGSLLLEAGRLKDGENSIIFEAPGGSVYLSGAALEIESADDGNLPPAETEALGSASPGTSARPEFAPVPTPTPAPVAPLVLSENPPGLEFRSVQKAFELDASGR